MPDYRVDFPSLLDKDLKEKWEWGTDKGIVYIIPLERLVLRKAADKFKKEGSDKAAEYVYEELKKLQIQNPPKDGDAYFTYIKAGKSRNVKDFCNLIFRSLTQRRQRR